MENKINVQKALKFLLNEEYRKGFVRRKDGSIVRNKNGSWEEWLKKNGLLESEEEQKPQQFAEFPDLYLDHVDQQLSELGKYKAVNATKNLKELAEVILSLADPNGMIQGRELAFTADRMAENCLNIENVPSNTLTRMYGIRQQALYLQKYGKNS